MMEIIRENPDPATQEAAKAHVSARPQKGGGSRAAMEEDTPHCLLAD